MTCLNHASLAASLAALTVAADAAAASKPESASGKRPGIIVIMSDQQTAAAMSCAGNPWVRTQAMDALSADDRLTLETARSIREDFLQQNAFEGEDSYTSLEKQHTLMKLIFAFEDKARRAVADGADVEDVSNLPVRERIGRFKAVPSASCRAEADAVTAAMTAERVGLVARARHA